MTHICVSDLTIIGSDNGLSPGRRQAINWTNAGIVLIRTIWTNFREIWSEKNHTISLKKMHLKMSSGKWRPFCLGLNVLKGHILSGVHSWNYSTRTISFSPITAAHLNIGYCRFQRLWGTKIIAVVMTSKQHTSLHYSGVSWASWRLKSLTIWMFVPQLVQTASKKSSQLCVTEPFVRVTTGYRRIPPTKGQ